MKRYHVLQGLCFSLLLAGATWAISQKEFKDYRKDCQEVSGDFKRQEEKQKEFREFLENLREGKVEKLQEECDGWAQTWDGWAQTWDGWAQVFRDLARTWEQDGYVKIRGVEAFQALYPHRELGFALLQQGRAKAARSQALRGRGDAQKEEEKYGTAERSYQEAEEKLREAQASYRDALTALEEEIPYAGRVVARGQDTRRRLYLRTWCLAEWARLLVPAEADVSDMQERIRQMGDWREEIDACLKEAETLGDPPPVVVEPVKKGPDPAGSDNEVLATTVEQLVKEIDWPPRLEGEIRAQAVLPGEPGKRGSEVEPVEGGQEQPPGEETTPPSEEGPPAEEGQVQMAFEGTVKVWESGERPGVFLYYNDRPDVPIPIEKLEEQKNGLVKFSYRGLVSSADAKRFRVGVQKPDSYWRLHSPFINIPPGVTPAPPPEENIRRYALLVGVSEYDQTRLDTFRAGLEPLAAPDNDVEAFEKCLRGSNQVREGFWTEIRVMNTRKKDSPDYPTRANVEAAVQEIRGKLQRGDLALFYFAGHGWLVEGKGTYLVLADTEYDTLAETGYTAQDVAAAFQKCQNVLCILDVCHAAGSTVDVDLPNVRVLGSSGRNQYAIEDQGYGIFAQELDEALRGGADRDRDNKISLLEAFSYVAREVPKRSSAWGMKQEPTIQLGGGGMTQDVLLTLRKLPGSA